MDACNRELKSASQRRSHDDIVKNIKARAYDLVILGSGHRDGWAARLYLWDQVGTVGLLGCRDIQTNIYIYSYVHQFSVHAPCMLVVYSHLCHLCISCPILLYPFYLYLYTYIYRFARAIRLLRSRGWRALIIISFHATTQPKCYRSTPPARTTCSVERGTVQISSKGKGRVASVARYR